MILVPIWFNTNIYYSHVARPCVVLVNINCVFQRKIKKNEKKTKHAFVIEILFYYEIGFLKTCGPLKLSKLDAIRFTFTGVPKICCLR